MAYMSHDSFMAGEAVGAAEAARFSPIELRAIQIGERVDVADERPAGSRRARLLEFLFGLPAARSLADPGLEALRRFASKARHHRDALREEDVEALVAAGYTAGQAWGLFGYLAGRPRPGVRA